MNAARFAYNGALVGWNASDFIPSETYGWNTYSARADRYATNMGYYNNTVYDSAINSAMAVMTFQKKLYKYVRGVRTPVARSVDFFVGKVYIGSLDMETAETGAIPIQADKRIRDAIIHLWDTSSWGVNKNIYVRDAATKGDTFIKLVNDPIEGCVYMEMVDPSYVTDYILDKQGLITYAVIEYTVYEDSRSPLYSTQNSYVYKEVIQADGVKTHFATYKNNQPFAFNYNEAGELVSEWDTGYGFVPLSLGQFTNMGLKSGASCFQTSIGKVDELNDAASLLNDQVRNAVQVAFLMPGTSAPRRDGTTVTGAEITYNRDEKTNIPIIHAGKDATAIPLIAQIDIAAALANVESIELSMEGEMPEIALHRIWSMSTPPSGIAMNKVYDPVSTRVKIARSNLDGALVNAQQMGIAIGAYHGYPEYSAFSVDDYMNGGLKHSIKDRTVFDDSVDKSAKILALGTVKDQPSSIAELILEELDYDQKVIAAVVSQLDEQQASADAAAARAFSQSVLGGQGNGQPMSNQLMPMQTQRQQNGVNLNGTTQNTSTP